MVTDLAIDLAYFALVAASARPRRLMAAVLVRGAVDGCLGRGGRAPAKTQVAAARISWSVAK
jgi:rhamnosyltransferase